MTPVELYEQWEKEAPVSICHVMVIDRGDDTAANRLTLTDKPFYDKGKDGVKYHHTYPAPVHCIISDIVTDEQRNGTSFQDIVIVNDGRFDSILSTPNIIGKRFSILRGDQNWSLMEMLLPYKFIEIIIGEIADVVFQSSGRISLKIRPVSYRLTKTIGSNTLPVGYGKCFHVPAVLQDSATLRYRVNSIITSTSGLSLKDNGSPLVQGPDYSRVKEDEDLVEDAAGTFRGLIQLAVAPSGQLTADLNYVTAQAFGNNPSQLNEIIAKILFDHVVDHPAIDKQFSVPLVSNTVGTSFDFCLAETRLFYHYGDFPQKNYILQIDLSTGGDLDTAVATAKILDVSAYADQWLSGWISVSEDGTKLYITNETYAINNQYIIYQFNLGTPGEIDTAVYYGQFTLVTSSMTGCIVTDDKIIFAHFQYLKQYDITGGDVTTATNLQTIFIFQESIEGLDITEDESKLYIHFSDTSRIIQYDLATPGDLTERVYTDRELLLYLESSIGHFKISQDGTRVYAMWPLTASAGIKIFDFSPISDHNLPRVLVAGFDQGGIENEQCGIFVNSETQVGSMISQLARSFGNGEFCVDRFGVFVVTRDVGPITPDYFEIHEKDCLGEQGKHLTLKRIIPPLSKVTALYKKNYTIQNPATLAGIAADSVLEFSTDYVRYVALNTLTGFDDAEEVIFETMNDINAATNAYAATSLASARNQTRQELAVNCKLSTVSLLENFRVGGRVRLINFTFPTIPYDDDSSVQCVVTGRTVNWSKNSQTLQVFK